MYLHMVHDPDYTFQKFIERTFGINRGIYNRIDEWFYCQGINDVINRRVLILEFSSFVAESKLKMGSPLKIKFGHGGLKEKLNNFWDGRCTVNVMDEKTRGTFKASL